MRFNDSFYMVRRVKVCFLTTHPVLSVNLHITNIPRNISVILLALGMLGI